MSRISIELMPFSDGSSHCHFAIVGTRYSCFVGGSARGSIFEAAAAAFHMARTFSRAKSFAVVVL